MEHYVTADAIRALREKKGVTQKQLAQQLQVSDKTVSKWETGRGLPDITLLEPLGRVLGVSVAELLSGDCVTNRNRSGNMLRSTFYVCPICGNLIHAMGQGAFSCCGVTLPALEPEPAELEHQMNVQRIENDWYITLEHPMTREHYISFLAYVTTDRIQVLKLYPQQEAEGRFPIAGPGKLYAYCSHHGLVVQFTKTLINI